MRAERLENTWADGFILLADGIQAVDAVYDICATAEKVRAENEDKSCTIDAWVTELQRREDREGMIASVTIFLAGGQKCK